MNNKTTEREMFEKSFERPRNFYELTGEEQWAIDKHLGILDWQGDWLTPEDLERLKAHFSDNGKQ